MTTLLTLPIQLIAFCPGKSVGNSPLTAPFMEAVPLYASMSGVLSVMFPAMPSSSVMVMPTMSVMFPLPYTVMTGSAKTLPGFSTNEPLRVRVMGATSFGYSAL